MTEPSPSRPVPGPPRYPFPAAPTGHRSGEAQRGPAGTADDPTDRVADDTATADGPAGGGADPGVGQVPGSYAERPYAALDQRPVAEHVAVFEAEHARLQDELSTIDRL